MHNYISTHLRIYVSTLDSSVARKWRCTLRPLYLCAVPDSASPTPRPRDAHARSSPSMIEFGALALASAKGESERKKKATRRIRMNAFGCLG
ncbi:hypothetical protein GGP41_000700 [Bipolaris sorokiniana]|uniref:Uncharacterized protein n=1 Tax=Cochliobolus sativus TaxID=45130 RepID=A0A8H5ZPS2_COCSA|nr:hypothetical protein GGP41_000700 [Bipolaris sorokiniana]